MSDSQPGRHQSEKAPSRHLISRSAGYLILVAALVLGLSGVYAWRHFNENLTVENYDDQLGSDRPKKEKVEGPKEPLNVLVMGSDTREGDNNIDGLTGHGELSDTTILFHLSADRKFAYGVSLPRDAMVERPTCFKKNGEEIPGGLDMWNAAYSYGGPACTIRQFEQLTGIKIDHSVVVDFSGFKDMVDALDGVEVCVPEEVDDSAHGIHLDAGTREIRGQEALNYVRVRSNISSNGDIGRMKRQQVFIASMANKVASTGMLGHPVRLVKFLNAATKSLTLDHRMGSVKKIADVARQFQDIGLDNIKFITVPWGWYEPDPNRVVWTEDANILWKKIKFDKPLSKRLSSEVITAAKRPGEKAATSGEGDARPGAAPSPAASESSSSEPTPEEVAEENGLCS